MEELHAAIEALNTESVQQISGVVAALQRCAASGLQPRALSQVIAEAIRIRTPEHFLPLMCVLDVILKAPASDSAQPLVTIVGFVFTFLPSAFASASSKAIPEKTLRRAVGMVQRWQSKAAMSTEVAEKIVAAMKGQSQEKVEEHVNTTSAVEADAAEVIQMTALLTAVARLVAQLPPHRADAYHGALTDLVHSQADPSQARAVIAQLAALREELSAEVVALQDEASGKGGNWRTLVSEVHKRARDTDRSKLDVAPPLISDIDATQSWGQRVGDVSKAVSITRQVPHMKGVQNPFQLPASVSKARGGAVRKWFLDEASWATTEAFASVIPLATRRDYTEELSTSVFDVARRNERPQNT